MEKFKEMIEIELPVPEKFRHLDDEKIFKLMVGATKFINDKATQICKQEGLGKMRIPAVAESLARNRGLAKYGGYWVIQAKIETMVIPSIFKKLIDKYGKKED